MSQLTVKEVEAKWDGVVSALRKIITIIITINIIR